MARMVFESASLGKDYLALTTKSGIEVTFTANATYINGELLYKLANTITDSDGYEYDCTIFDMARTAQS